MRKPVADHSPQPSPISPNMKCSYPALPASAGSPVPGEARASPSALRESLSRVQQELPALLDQAVAHYRAACLSETPLTSKAMATHQSACRLALAHIEQLVRLCRTMAADVSPDSAHSDDLFDGNALLAEARRAFGEPPNVSENHELNTLPEEGSNP